MAISSIRKNPFLPPGSWWLVDALRLRGYHQIAQAGRVTAPRAIGVRKVRTPQSAMPGNTRGGETCRIGPQKQTTCYKGDGEMVV
jgi:hypothetical protein